MGRGERCHLVQLCIAWGMEKDRTMVIKLRESGDTLGQG